MTRAKAEELVKEWAKAGEVQRDQVQDRVDDIVDRSRKNTEQFLDMIRKEISNQLASLGLATKEDLARLEARLTGQMAANRTAPPPKKAAPPPPKAADAKKAAAKKAGAKKATAGETREQPPASNAGPSAGPAAKGSQQG
jgi:hypothetical protein